jgi:protein CpxP
MSFFNRNKWWAIAFILLVVMNIATLTTFWLLKQRQDGPGIRPQSGVADFLTNELGFDSLQKQKLIQLRDAHQLEVRELRKGNREVKEAFFELLKQPDISDSVVQASAKKSFQFDVQSELLTFRHFQEIRKLCTDTQKKKFDEIIQEVLRMMAPPPPGRGRPEGPPPPNGDNGRPPREDSQQEPPPPPKN